MPAFLPQNFLGLPAELCDPLTARLAVLPVPYDGTTTFAGGARCGPAALLEASRQVELYDRELARAPAEVGAWTSPPLEPQAAGPEAMADAVEQAVAELLAAGKQVLTVGGEHSVAVGAARAHARRYPGISFLVVDAHLDLRDQYQGSRLSHACASRRMLELGPLSLVGCRSVAEEELAVLREESRLAVVWAEEVAAARSRDGWIEAALAGLGPEVYVSFDVDGLDPSVIPGTGTPEPGGLGWYDALALLRRLGESRRVVGYDLCELAPIPGSSVSEFAAARLAYKMLGYFEHPRKGMRCPAG